MKFVSLHTKNTTIVYKNTICSSATLAVLVFVLLSLLIPILLVSQLGPYAGINDSRVHYEQPRLQFQYQSIFLAETMSKQETGVEELEQGKELVACSTYAAFNERLERYTRSCAGSKYWSEDFNNDGILDRAHFQLRLDNLPARIRSYDLTLFFEAKLQHKCLLSPPAVLTHHLSLPEGEQLQNGTIHLKAELTLKQYVEFICPSPGRNARTHFRPLKLATLNNNSSASAIVDIKEFQSETLLQQLKTNHAYFQLQLLETYFRHNVPNGDEGLRILLDVDVLQVPARYYLGVLERLGQFWLYFASFFGISFYIMNKLKDFLFGRHIIRSWEIIPWKKLY